MHVLRHRLTIMVLLLLAGFVLTSTLMLLQGKGSRNEPLDSQLTSAQQTTPPATVLQSAPPPTESPGKTLLFLEDFRRWPLGKLRFGIVPENPQIWEISEIPVGSRAEAEIVQGWSWPPSDRSLRLRTNTQNPKKYDGIIAAHGLPMTAKGKMRVSIWYLPHKTLFVGALEFQLIYADMNQAHQAAIRWTRPEKRWLIWSGPKAEMKQVKSDFYPADGVYHRLEMTVDLRSHRYGEVLLDGFVVYPGGDNVVAIDPEGQVGAVVRVYLEASGPWGEYKESGWPEVHLGKVMIEELD